jgi:hypothetical protein
VASAPRFRLAPLFDVDVVVVIARAAIYLCHNNYERIWSALTNDGSPIVNRHKWRIATAPSSDATEVASRTLCAQPTAGDMHRNSNTSVIADGYYYHATDQCGTSIERNVLTDIQRIDYTIAELRRTIVDLTQKLHETRPAVEYARYMAARRLQRWWRAVVYKLWFDVARREYLAASAALMQTR